MHSDNYGMRSNENKIEILITRYTENKDLRQKLEDKKWIDIKTKSRISQKDKKHSSSDSSKAYCTECEFEMSI